MVLYRYFFHDNESWRLLTSVEHRKQMAVSGVAQDQIDSVTQRRIRAAFS